MRGKIVVGAVFVCLFATSVFGDPNTQIRYQTTDLGSGRWEYSYTVVNLLDSLIPEIEEFTIWFDYDLYSDLNIETTTLESSNPPAGNWHEIVWQREEVLRDDGGYDALALDTGIVIGEAIRGFAVSFYWLPGTGVPGSQLYHIVDPDNYPVPIETGYTVPEPATLLLFGLGGLGLIRSKRRA